MYQLDDLDPRLTDTAALQKIIRANRNRVEIELAELLMDIMESRNIDAVDFCLNDILNLFDYQRVKTDRTALRKVVQECWKLRPAPNSLCYTTYQMSYNVFSFHRFFIIGSTKQKKPPKRKIRRQPHCLFGAKILDETAMNT